MQQDFICSPINRQIGCKQFVSNVVGGPASTILPVCSVFVCNDDCTTGDLDYTIGTLDDFYGKRVVIIKTVDTTATGNKIRVISPSSNFVSTGSTTLNLPDLPSTTELVFPIGAGSEIGVSSYDAASGSTINIYTADGTLTADRTVECDDKQLVFKLSNAGSMFLVSRDGTFPATAVDDAAVFVEPYDFSGSGKPAAGIGYSVDHVTNDSVGFLASEVTGSKAAMVISTSGNNTINSMVLVNDSGIQVASNDATDNASLNVASTGITLDGGSQQSVKIQGVPNATASDVVYYDSGTNALSHSPLPAPVNLYTADGTIGGVRTVNLNDQILTFQGTGNDFFQVQGIQELDIDANTNISIQTPQLIIVPQFPLDNTVNDIVVQDPGTGQIKRRSAATIGGSNAIFSVGQNPVTAAYPAVNTTNDIVGLDVSSPLNHTGYNSGAINLVSGVFSPPTLDKYQVILKISLKNLTVQGRWILQLYCITDLQNVSQSEQWNANSPNTFQDFYLHDCLILDPAKTYKFRVRDLTTLGISSYANTTVMLNYA